MDFHINSLKKNKFSTFFGSNSHFVNVYFCNTLSCSNILTVHTPDDSSECEEFSKKKKKKKERKKEKKRKEKTKQKQKQQCFMILFFMQPMSPIVI